MQQEHQGLQQEARNRAQELTHSLLLGGVLDGAEVQLRRQQLGGALVRQQQGGAGVLQGGPGGARVEEGEAGPDLRAHVTFS
jgi:hypothetical protein